MAKTIMVVDDSASMRQMVNFTIKHAGYDTVEAIDGQDALTKLKGSAVHMVITDLNMPNLDGIGLIRGAQGPRQQVRPYRDAHHRISGFEETRRQSGRRHRMDRQTLQAGSAHRRGKEGARMTVDHREAFVEEAHELLAELENSLLELEETPDDKELVGRVFRAMHTIKGSGAMFGFDDIAAFTHEVESVYDKVREDKLLVTTELDKPYPSRKGPDQAHVGRTAYW